MSNIRSAVAGFALFASLTAAAQQSVSDITGVIHWAPRYRLDTTTDSLNEGAARVRTLGTRTIKVAMNPRYNYYPIGSVWPTWTYDDNTLVQMAQHPYYQSLFAKDFTTFVLSNENSDLAGGSTQDYNRVHNLAKYLLETYRNSGKTFIFTTWEGDNNLYSNGVCQVPQGTQPRSDPSWCPTSGTVGPGRMICGCVPDGMRKVPTQESVDGIVNTLNTRQNAVTNARLWAAGRGYTGVQVYNAAEVNYVSEARVPTYVDYDNNPSTPPETMYPVTLTNDVLPRVNCDLYAYSSWDIFFPDPEQTRDWLYQNLRHLAAQAPASAAFGEFNLMLGEYGFLGHEEAHARRMTDLGLGFGLRKILWWQLYSNDGTTDDGTALVRQNGTKVPFTNYFEARQPARVYRFALQTWNGTYAGPWDGGGWGEDSIVADSPDIDEWERVTILDPNGGDLTHGDKVYILTPSGYYFAAVNGGGSGMAANTPQALTWEEFTILKLNGTGAIGHGDRVAFRTYSGAHYVAATYGGGPGSVLTAQWMAIGTWEQFTLVKWMP